MFSRGSRSCRAAVEEPSHGEQCLAPGVRALGERWYESQILRTLALTATLQGRYQQAESELRGLEVAVELGDLAGAASRLRESIGGGITVESDRWEIEHPRDAARRLLTDSQVV